MPLPPPTRNPGAKKETRGAGFFLCRDRRGVIFVLQVVIQMTGTVAFRIHEDGSRGGISVAVPASQQKNRATPVLQVPPK
jgi:hypothetical protein